MPWHWSKNIPCLHRSSGVKSRHVVIGFPKLIEVNCILISSQPRIACLDREHAPSAGSDISDILLVPTARVDVGLDEEVT
jgi:hypothetical protein